MKNELQIKPLREYRVKYAFNINDDVFTADSMVRDERDLLFYRTGNLIRIYTPDAQVVSVTITPVDDAEIPE